jgi:hypothetical protein
MTVFEDKSRWDLRWSGGIFLGLRVGWAFVRRGHVGVGTRSAAVEDGWAALVLGVIVIAVGRVGVAGINGVGYGHSIHVGIIDIAG